MQVQYRTYLAEARADDPLAYVMSDGSRDRHGTIIEPSGWQLENFKRNPIALFNHNKDFIVGQWENVRIEGGRLIGYLRLLPKGVSQRLDEIRAAVEHGVLRAVSVGFILIDADGDRYKRQELLECSLVSVGSNVNAMEMARSLNLSDHAKSVIFGEPAKEDQDGVGRFPGESAEPQSKSKARKMNLSQQIEAARTRLNDLRDQRARVLEEEGDELSDEAVEAVERLNQQVSGQERKVAALEAAEQQNAHTSVPANRAGGGGNVSNAGASRDRVWAKPKKEIKPADLIIRAAAVRLLSRVEGKHPGEVLQERYGGHPDTRTVFDVVTRTATTPATTTTTGWAAELVETSVADFLDTLAPDSIYPKLAAIGGRFTFGRSGTVSVPSRASTPTVAGSFVAQGSPIPVRQAAFAAVTLTPKKMGVISTFTREIAEHSTPQIETLIREAINEDTAVALDTVLLDTTAASTTRPAGLRNGVTGNTATAGGGIAALTADLGALLADLAAGSNGMLRRPVLVANPVDAMRIGLLRGEGGGFAFPGVGAQGGTLAGFPLITSYTVTAGMVVMLDAADFFSATGDEPRFDISDQAVLHMEDTTPLAIGTTGTPNTVAAPVRSLWQTDTLAIRMLLDVNWTMRRAGTVAFVTDVTW